jgi:hypothetical protein
MEIVTSAAPAIISSKPPDIYADQLLDFVLVAEPR